MITNVYQVSNRDGSADFTSRRAAIAYARNLHKTGWIGDTVKVVVFERASDGHTPVSMPETIWSKVRT